MVYTYSFLDKTEQPRILPLMHDIDQFVDVEDYIN